MNRYGSLQGWLVVNFLVAAGSLMAADSVPPPFPSRPYLLVFVSSIDRILSDCGSVFESVDRHDLSVSVNDRLKSFRDFAGIDRTKPFGIMTMWHDVAPAEIVFLPVQDIEELLKTATFGVGYHQVDVGRFEIERPVSPYHVLVRNDYALSADSPRSIQALSATPEQLTRGLRDRYDAAFQLDLKQVPRLAKVVLIDGLRGQVEPWLQPHDNEVKESANLRRTLGKMSLEFAERLILDTNTVTIGGQLDQKSHHLILEATIDATAGSAMATQLNRLASYRSEFSSLISPDVAAGIALNLPLGGLIDRILGKESGPNLKGGRLEAGLQLVGTEYGNFSLITALRGEEAIELNKAIPQLIVKMQKSGQFETVHENFDVHREVVLHSLIPHELPTSITQLVGSEAEIIVAQGTQTIWVGIGRSETLLKRIQAAIELVEDSPVNGAPAPLVRARFQTGQLPEIPASELLAANIDNETKRAELIRGQDGFSVTIDPVANGLKVRIEAEEGFIRLVGKDWIKQIESLIE